MPSDLRSLLPLRFEGSVETILPKLDDRLRELRVALEPPG
jgi:hypothetical protein